jgi:hypothetical protein
VDSRHCWRTEIYTETIKPKTQITLVIILNFSYSLRYVNLVQIIEPFSITVDNLQCISIGRLDGPM